VLRAPAVSLPARALAVLLAATRMDVLDEEVYTWRAGSAARGLSADTDPVGPPPDDFPPKTRAILVRSDIGAS